jgi:UDP-N-acetylmuramoyl-tripeptide--D-alanyl-D-alanine ligase
MRIYLKEIKERYPEFEILNYSEDVYFEAFNHDSRVEVKNSLFIPIIGDTFDGHNYVEEAFKKGSVVSLFQRDRLKNDLGGPIIVVDSIEEGLEKIVKMVRDNIKIPIIGITGSTGKTVTREMLSSILSTKGRVLKSERNYNTLWGNAIVLSEYDNHDYVVLEVGMDRKGEIAWQCRALQPDIGALLNVGYVHAMQLGGIENVYLAKKELADYLIANSKPVIINIDDSRLTKIQETKYSDITTLGMSNADYSFKDLSVDTNGTHFTLLHENKEYVVSLSILGKGYVYNALAAIAISTRLGFSLDEAVSSISNFKGFTGRFEILNHNSNTTLINDAYNANPTSMKMALETYNEIWGEKEVRKILVLGDMKELGEVTEEKHIELGNMVREMSVDEVYYVGEYFNSFNYGKHFKSTEELYNHLLEDVKSENEKVILFKASHSIGLEDVINRLTTS